MSSRASQRTLLNDFITLTGASERLAQKVMSRNSQRILKWKANYSLSFSKLVRGDQILLLISMAFHKLASLISFGNVDGEIFRKRPILPYFFTFESQKQMLYAILITLIQTSKYSAI